MPRMLRLGPLATILFLCGCGRGDDDDTGESVDGGESESEGEDKGDCDCERRECHSATCPGDGTCAYTAIPHLLCDDGDPCTEVDVCDESGDCAGERFTCDAPPPPECADASTLRTFDEGVCNGDGCDYEPSAGACPSVCIDATCCTLTVASEEIGAATGRPSLALNPAGAVRVAYQSGTLLRYSAPGATSWSMELADTDSDSEFSPSLVVAADTIAQMVYLRDGALRLARRTSSGGVWTSAAAGSGADRASPSLAVDGNALELLFDQPGAGDCRSVVRSRSTGGAWSEESADLCGAAPALAVASGTLHMAYLDDGVRYGRHSSGAATWNFVQIAEGGDEIGAPVIAVSPNGLAHIVYANGVTVEHAQGSLGAGFETEDVAAGARPAVAVDAEGGVHVALDADGELLYGRRSGPEVWALESVSSHEAVAGSDIVVDATGVAHLAWTADGALGYASVTLACE